MGRKDSGLEEALARTGHMGTRIRALRLGHTPSLSQSQLSLAAQVPLGNIQRWESGGRCGDFEALTRIAVVLGTSLDYLVRGIELGDGVVRASAVELLAELEKSVAAPGEEAPAEVGTTNGEGPPEGGTTNGAEREVCRAAV